MTTNLTIRGVRDDDMSAIQAIYADDVLNRAASWELVPPDVAELTRRRDALLVAGYPYLVAERKGRVAGYAYAGPYRPRPGYFYTVENSIYVHPDFWGKGVAPPLLQAVIDTCTTLGKRQMVAVVGDAENHASIRFHEKMGFTRAGAFPGIGWKFGRWIDSVYLIRPLGDGKNTLPE